MQPGVDGEDIFTYSRLRRRPYSSKTEIYQKPLSAFRIMHRVCERR